MDDCESLLFRNKTPRQGRCYSGVTVAPSSPSVMLLRKVQAEHGSFLDLLCKSKQERLVHRGCHRLLFLVKAGTTAGLLLPRLKSFK